MLGNDQYNIGTYIRRGVYGTPDVDHPPGSNFALLNSQIFKITLPLSYAGKTLHFKFTAFNKLLAEEQGLSDVVDYPFTVFAWPPTGSGGGFYINGSTP